MKKTLIAPSGKTNIAMRARNLALLPLLFACATPLFAADAPKDPARQTSWGLYVDSREAYQMKTGGRGQEMLLVDVRDPIEIMFTGFADVADVNVPYMTSNRQKWNDKKSVFAMEVNPTFEPLVAKAFEGKGYKQVYVVTDGFEGDTVKEGDKKNWRLVNGWKISGLPWGYTLNKGEFSS